MRGECGGVGVERAPVSTAERTERKPEKEHLTLGVSAVLLPTRVVATPRSACRRGYGRPSGRMPGWEGRLGWMSWLYALHSLRATRWGGVIPYTPRHAKNGAKLP